MALWGERAYYLHTIKRKRKPEFYLLNPSSLHPRLDVILLFLSTLSPSPSYPRGSQVR